MSRELFVPGRLCLFGEHSDWAAGYRRTDPEIAPGGCLVSGTDQGLHATADAHPDALEITTVLPHGEEIGPARLAADRDSLHAAAQGADFFSYVAGVAAEIQARFDVGGLRLALRSDLPVRKGLSSSAAVSVLVARAYSEVYGLDLTIHDEMDLAYEGERRTGSECGRMDQICAFGRRVTRVGFDEDRLEVDEVEVGAAFSLVIVDLRRGKDTRRILADLNACYPDTQGPVAEGVREALGHPNLELLGRARKALENGDAEALGRLMTEAQDRFDRGVAPACAELRSPRLHEVLAHPAVRDEAFGGKGVGSQGDGCAQLVARDDEARERLIARLEREAEVQCHRLTIEPADGEPASG